MKYKLLFNSALELFNNCFWGILSIVIFVLIFIGVYLYFKRVEDGDKRWYRFVYIVKKRSIEMFLVLFMSLILVLFLNEIFSIDILNLLDVSRYGKIIFSIWLIKTIISEKKIYNELNFKEFLRKAKNGDYYTAPENILKGEIENYNFRYTLLTEQLGILKSMTPISLLPVIAGYVLEGKDISVNWDKYTIIFFVILFMYLYNIRRCYGNMKFWKMRIWEVQEELRDLQYKKENNKKEMYELQELS